MRKPRTLWKHFGFNGANVIMDKKIKTEKLVSQMIENEIDMNKQVENEELVERIIDIALKQNNSDLQDDLLGIAYEVKILLNKLWRENRKKKLKKQKEEQEE